MLICVLNDLSVAEKVAASTYNYPANNMDTPEEGCHKGKSVHRNITNILKDALQTLFAELKLCCCCCQNASSEDAGKSPRWGGIAATRSNMVIVVNWRKNCKAKSKRVC